MNKYVLTLFSLLIFGEIFSQITYTQIGASTYDLQTNAAIERRVAYDRNSGKIVFTYTGAPLLSNNVGNNFPDRGTGYYYYSGSGSMTPQTGFPGRIEQERTGWPSVAILASGKEVIVNHRAGNSSGLTFLSRATAGTGTWTETRLTNSGETWPRLAHTGDSIVVITTVASDKTQFGMNGGLSIKRSINGGATWMPADSTMDSIPGINIAKYPNRTSGTTTVNEISADGYAFDVKGNRIAILTGGSDITLFISEDFGTTWSSKTLIVGDNNTTDTLVEDNRSRGDFSVLIDNNNKIHCFWGRSWASNYLFYYTPVGIMYWNENMPTGSAPVLLRQTMYEKELNGEIYIPFYTQNLYAPALYTGHRMGYTSHPSSGIDASGNIYLCFSRVRGISDTARFNAGFCADINKLFYNNVYLMKSTDGGNTWVGPINVSNSDVSDNVFPSMARTVGTEAHILFQSDSLVGNALQANTELSHSGNITINKMMYAKVPVSSIVDIKLTPPVMGYKDSLTAKLGITRFKGDTLDNIVGCNKFTGTNVPTFTDPLQFAKDYLVNVLYDDRDTGTNSMLKIHTPNGAINFNSAGMYLLKAYAQDSDGNTSASMYGVNQATTNVFGSLDSFTLYFNVTPDVGKPNLNMNPTYRYIYLGQGPVSPPSLSPIDDNPCKPDSVYLTNQPVAGTIEATDINTIGVSKYAFAARDVANNYTYDTFFVYVGKEPTPVIENEVFNSTTKKITAKGSSSQIMPFGNTTYTWTYKSTGTVGPGSSSIGSSADLSSSAISSSFDSICLAVSNEFNKAPFSKPIRRVCKPLKSTGSISSSNNQVEVTIFPNPNQGNFNIAVSGNKSNKAVVSITALDGRKLAENRVEIKNGLIPMSLNLSSGTYFLSTEIDGAVKLDKIEIK